MTLLGGVIGIFGTRGIRKANAARNWPVVTGIVTASYTYEFRDSEGSNMFKPIVHYDYTVDGEPHRSETLALSGVVSTSWRSPADRIVAAYPQDQPCRVYYNPDDPQEACLRPGAGWHYYLMTGIGYLLALIGSGLLLR